MNSILVQGGRSLYGSIAVSGSKNATLPIMAAAALCDGQVCLTGVPMISDVYDMVELLSSIGVNVDTKADDTGLTLTIEAANLVEMPRIPAQLTNKLRASILMLGAMLARRGRVTIDMPGGCTIGSRPIDLHIAALRAMGAEIEILDDGCIVAKATGPLRGGYIEMPNVSVGATQNIMLAASTATGLTTIRNAAIEPEVLELAGFLSSIGVQIMIEKNGTIAIHGAKKLASKCAHLISGDRIEAGTYAMAIAATGGEVELINVDYDMNRSWISTLATMNVNIKKTRRGILVARTDALGPISVTTRPHPYFPSDLQAQLTAVAAYATGISVVCETLYENRFMHIANLRKMGANIEIVDNRAIIVGCGLHSAEVFATDLRAGSALVIAALAAKGESVIMDAHYMDRGYQDIELKLSGCGAYIKRI